MKKITAVTILLLAGILLLVNVLSQRFFVRLDFTEGKQYTLSKATRDILKNLDNPVTVTAYFSENLPPDLENIKQDFQEMLVEYRNTSKNMLDYQFVDPGVSEEKEQEAAQSGIRPVMINTRDKDQSKQQKAFLGAIIKMGEQTDVIPLVVSGTGMEYALSTGIKKISVADKPSVGIVQGNGEPSLQELGQVYQSLSILYTVEPVSLGTETDLSKYKAIAIVAPADSFPPDQLAKLDSYLGTGGNLFIAINRVNGDLQTQSGTVVNTGLETWLQGKGINVEPSFILDSQCGSVTVQQQQGFFMINTPVQFPYLPLLSQFPENPITKGLEQVILPFASPVNYTGSGTWTTFLHSSAKAATSPAPTNFNVMGKQWTAADFQQSNITIGGILEEAGPGKMIVIGDGDFPVTGQGRGQSEDNINLMVNSIDWLSDDTGLIELRTKGVATRPIKEEYLGDDNAGTRNMLKYLNFGLPILLVVLYGFFRNQRQRSLRMQRMQERYA
ncbi:MAG: Gldg family protein [Lewinellaceae bacterium]|nr:Gldg family protein [Saprospiraceae bacterium]MCB9341637.1 Gldg family protein [Lewinellaceae bacterium]